MIANVATIRAELRLKDLGERHNTTRKLINVRIPADLLGQIERAARELRCSKTEVTIALLNEGLDAAGNIFRGRKGRPRVKS